jgi:DNA-binding transcriptional ArsR family regulator
MTTTEQTAQAPIREDVLKALREKPEGLTRTELRWQFLDVPYDEMGHLLMGLYDEGLVGLDVVSDSRRPRWKAAPKPRTSRRRLKRRH